MYLALCRTLTLPKSINFAEKIEYEFSNRAKRKSRGIKQAPFYVISRANMPAVLIEAGFLTNPKEEDYLNSEEGQSHIASAIFRAFRSYYNEQTELMSEFKNSNKKVKINKNKNDSLKFERVVYKVQIGTYLKSMLNSRTFNDIKDLEEVFVNGSYKYYIRCGDDKKFADDMRKNMIENGFSGSFVTAFYKGKQISTKEALNLQIFMNKEIRTGIIAIFTIIVLIYGINYLKGLNILDKNRIFHAKYDNIDGLLKGSVISLNGFNVGIVSNIRLQSDNSLLVSVKINEDFDVPANSILKISNQDLMGTKGISVILGNSDLLAKNNDTLIAEIENSLQDEVNKQILPLKNKAEGLISSVDSLMVIFTSVLNTDARKNLASSFKNLDETFILMSESMKELNKLVVTNEKTYQIRLRILKV